MAAETLTLAVRGHHFFRITRNLLEVERLKAALDAPPPIGPHSGGLTGPAAAGTR
jgi:hypothetical protein